MSGCLLKNICPWNWKHILAYPILEQLALDQLLSGKVLRSITPIFDYAIMRTERIVASLNNVWTGFPVSQ